MEITRLKPIYIEKLRASKERRMEVALSTGNSLNTIERWLRQNHEYLTLTDTLNAIGKHLKVPVKSLTQQIPVEEELT